MTLQRFSVPRLGLLVGGLPTAVYVLFVLLPLVALFARSIGGERFLSSITGEAALTALRLSLYTSAISMAAVVLVGTPFAYFLARSRLPGIRFLDSLVELSLVLPPVVAGLAMLMAFGRRGIIGRWLEAMGIVIPFTFVAVVFAQVFVAAPFYIRSARLGFEGVARDYEDISQTLGISPWRTFLRITLPLAWPSLLGGLALAWARAISEFGATIMFAGNFSGRTQTMPLAILSALESDLSAALAMSVLLVGVSVAILVALGFLSAAQRRFAP